MIATSKSTYTTTAHRTRHRTQSSPTAVAARPARGRHAPRDVVEDHLAAGESVVQGRPSAQVFIEQIVREMRIRYYQPNTIANYRHTLESLLRWFGQPPHRLTRDDVREFLLYLVDAGLSASAVGVHLSAIRTVFDKMCHRTVTLGLVTPRRPKQLPIVLNPTEVRRLLEAAPPLRDKLVLSLIYGTGLRVSEASRTRFSDCDLQRKQIRVWQGKGRKDRLVDLPESLLPLLQELGKTGVSDAYIFPGERPDRHVSARTIQRIMKRALNLAGISKPATPHSLRHSFATHSFEHGCDVRVIQKLLGHARLDTTTIYLQVAKLNDRRETPNPLDLVTGKDTSKRRPVAAVGKLRIHTKPTVLPENPQLKACLITLGITSDSAPTIYLTGIVATEAQPGWITLSIPPRESWEEPCRWLTPQQRERLQSPEFYELLQREVPRYFAEQFP
ncbi:MAG: tyrosine-type recombinase/integrase [Pirellulaceae bacterium]